MSKEYTATPFSPLPPPSSLSGIHIHEHWTMYPSLLAWHAGGRWKEDRVNFGQYAVWMHRWHQPRAGVHVRDIELAEGIVSRELYFLSIYIR
jgi:hypothetical protein